MVYVSASELCATPRGPWRKWTADARALAKSCKLRIAKWRQAESDSPFLALWAASFIKCARGKGFWVVAPLAQRQKWLRELQGTEPLYVN